jgi:hypothetical protein
MVVTDISLNFPFILHDFRETLDANFEVLQKSLNFNNNVFVIWKFQFNISDLNVLNLKNSLNSIQPNMIKIILVPALLKAIIAIKSQNILFENLKNLQNV